MAGVLEVAEPKSVRQRLGDVGEANGLALVECPSDEIPVAAQYLGEAAGAAPLSSASAGCGGCGGDGEVEGGADCHWRGCVSGSHFLRVGEDEKLATANWT